MFNRECVQILFYSTLTTKFHNTMNNCYIVFEQLQLLQPSCAVVCWSESADRINIHTNFAGTCIAQRFADFVATLAPLLGHTVCVASSDCVRNNLGLDHVTPSGDCTFTRVSREILSKISHRGAEIQHRNTLVPDRPRTWCVLVHVLFVGVVHVSMSITCIDISSKPFGTSLAPRFN